MRRRSLRSRLTLLVAAAVALAIAVCAGACWFIVRGALLNQVDRSLLEKPKGPPAGAQWMQDYCAGRLPALPPLPDLPGSGPDTLQERIRPPRVLPVQVIDDRGGRCVVGGLAVTVTPADRALAAAPEGTRTLRDGAAEDGTPMRVLTTSAGSGLAVMESRPLAEFQSTLTTLAWILAGVAALGVVGAASAGLLVSRTALRPVGRLAEAVEHVARTEDLGTRIPVEGTDEIARLGASFNAMTAALAGSRERQRRLIADAGHELRTPLTSLRTNVDLLLRSEKTGRPLAPEPKRRLLAGLKAQFEEMSTLVGDLLQLSRGEGDHEPHVEFAFHEVVRAAVERAVLRGADITAELDPWYAEGSASLMERAVLNLLDNAAKFGPGRVEVRLRGGELTVRDHGPGIPADELPHVFERFWRSPAARGLPGSGLGLAIVAQAVAEAGGTVRLGNAADGGVVAALGLPGAARPRSPAPASPR